MRGVYYPFRADSTVNRHMEVGASLTPAKNGYMDALNTRTGFKTNLMFAPINLPGNQIQGFRRTASPAQGQPRVYRRSYR